MPGAKYTAAAVLSRKLYQQAGRTSPVRFGYVSRGAHNSFGRQRLEHRQVISPILYGSPDSSMRLGRRVVSSQQAVVRVRVCERNRMAFTMRPSRNWLETVATASAIVAAVPDVAGAAAPDTHCNCIIASLGLPSSPELPNTTQPTAVLHTAVMFYFFATYGGPNRRS